MKTKRHILAALAGAAILTGCATVSRNPQQDIVGVWELTKALDLRPCDAGFVENIKLVFQPDGKVYRLDPAQTNLVEAAELNLFTYRFDGINLIRTGPDGESRSAPFSLRGRTLIITEADGEQIYYRKHASNPAQIPVCEARCVPFSVKYKQKKDIIPQEEKAETIIPLATVQKLKRAKLDCWDLGDRLSVFIIDDTHNVAGILEYGSLSKEEALAIVEAKKKELDKILDDEAIEHNERVRQNRDANKSLEATR